jgi:hypothetical protein
MLVGQCAEAQELREANERAWQRENAMRSKQRRWHTLLPISQRRI